MLSFLGESISFLLKIIIIFNFFYPEDSPMFKAGAHFSFN